MYLFYNDVFLFFSLKTLFKEEKMIRFSTLEVVTGRKYLILLLLLFFFFVEGGGGTIYYAPGGNFCKYGTAPLIYATGFVYR